jgi:hypothetical protein
MGIGMNHYFFWPFDSLAPLFNEQWLASSPSAYVILTDSIDFAAHNQHLLAQSKKSNVVWVSWYGENSAIDKVDWDPLKSRQVYYLLKEHSGFTAHDICKRALAVEEKLKTIDVELRYVSLLCLASSFDRKPGFDQRSPVIATSQMIHDYINNVEQSTTSFDKQPYNSYFKQQLPGKKLISPFIYERTATLLYGYPGVDLSWFALSLAFALANKMTFFNDWQAMMPGSVLYLRALDKSASTTLEEKLEILKELFHKTVKNKPEVIFNHPQINIFPNQQQKTSCFYVSEIDEGSQNPLEVIMQIGNQLLLKLDDQICKFVMHARSQGMPTLIILDGFRSLFELASLTAGRAFLMKMKEIDCAIIIIPPANMVTPKKLRPLKEKLPIDSIMQIAATDAPASALGMSIHIEKGFKIKADDDKLIRLELDLIYPQWRLVQTQQSWEDEIIQIARLQGSQKKMTAKQIAHTLGIPLSRTKLRIRQIKNPKLLPKTWSKAVKPKKSPPPPVVSSDENKQQE